MIQKSITKALRGCNKCRIITSDIRYKDGIIFENKLETFNFLKFRIFVIRYHKSKFSTVVLDRDDIIRIEVLE